MDEFFQMQIFFFITTVSVTVLTVLTCVALFYIVRILRRADRITEMTKEEAELVRNDIAELRANIKAEGLGWKHTFAALRKVIRRFIGRTRT